MGETENAIKTIAVHVRSQLKDVNSRLEKLSEQINDQDLEKRMNKLEEKIASAKIVKGKAQIDNNKLEDSRLEEIERKLESLESDIKSNKPTGGPSKELSDEKLEEFESRFAKLEENSKSVISAPIDSGLEERINSKISQINQKIISLTTPTSDNSKEIDTLRRTQTDQVKNSQQKLESVENLVKSEIQRLEDSMKKISHPEERKIEEYSKKLETIRSEMEKKTAEYSSKMESIKNQMEKNYQESEKRSTQAGKELGKEFEQKLGQIKDIDKRIGSIEEDLKTIHRTEKNVEEESVIIASIDKKMADLELFSKDMQAQIEYMKTVENKLDKSLDARATKMFTKQLEDMSRIMDKRFPTLITREDVSRHLAEINKRLDTIEAPDMAPLTEKVDYLEKKVEAIYNMLKNISNRIPVIVE